MVIVKFSFAGMVPKVRWARELRGGHVLLTGNDAHRRGVARTSGDLLAVRDGQVGLSEAEVDEVVRRGQGSNLSRRRSLLSVLLKARSNDLGIKRCERKKKTINIKLKKIEMSHVLSES